MSDLLQPQGLPRSEPTDEHLNVEEAVLNRYSAASRQAEPALCCPVEYSPKFLAVLPRELIERDYGCGDPSRFVETGDTVLDLGSGSGKICYIASQIVGPEGRVIGVDMNDDMLALARKHRDTIGQRIGWQNVDFHKGRIQDLKLDLHSFEAYLQQHPVQSSDDWLRAERYATELRQQQPMIPDSSVDVVLSNCVLNLVTPSDRSQLFQEVFRVLRRGGRAVISDIVSDEPVPEPLKNDPELWSGCISGAHVEDEFLAHFEQAGFYGIQIADRPQKPWATIEGIEFRSLTVRAFKGKQGPCMDHHQAVIYRGPWNSVTDDDGHVLRRGARTAVCEKTFRLYCRQPYAQDVIPVPPLETVSAEEAQPYDCHDNLVRSPRETKGQHFTKTSLPGGDCCGPTDCC